VKPSVACCEVRLTRKAMPTSSARSKSNIQRMDSGIWRSSPSGLSCSLPVAAGSGPTASGAWMMAPSASISIVLLRHAVSTSRSGSSRTRGARDHDVRRRSRSASGVNSITATLTPLVARVSPVPGGWPRFTGVNSSTMRFPVAAPTAVSRSGRAATMAASVPPARHTVSQNSAVFAGAAADAMITSSTSLGVFRCGWSAELSGV